MSDNCNNCKHMKDDKECRYCGYSGTDYDNWKPQTNYQKLMEEMTVDYMAITNADDCTCQKERCGIFTWCHEQEPDNRKCVCVDMWKRWLNSEVSP